MLFFLLLIFQIQILDAFILSCNESLQTVRRVTKCPSNISAYEEAVQKKNCSSLAPDAQTCQSFQYHCVLNDDLNYAIEVCAPSMYIVGKHACSYFNNNVAILASFKIKSQMKIVLHKKTGCWLFPATTGQKLY